MGLVRATAETIAKPNQRRTAIKPPSLAETKVVRDKMYGVINDAADYAPRSLQKEIGPSEIGDPCDYCLGARLAGLANVNPGKGWRTLTGTFVHDGLDAVFAQHEMEWLASTRLFVGYIDGRRIEGTVDVAYHETPFTVVDFKYVGKRTMDLVKFTEMKPIYRYQTQIYGRGYELMGHKPEYCAVAFLPLESQDVKRGYWWAEPYDIELVEAAMARAESIAKRIRFEGWEVVAPTLDKLDECYDCTRWTREGEIAESE